VTAALTALGVVLALGVLLWLLSLRLADASIADIGWGPLFVVVAVTTFALGHGSGARRMLVLALVVAWATRLSWHLARRSVGRGEDSRYRDLRARYGRRFWLVSLPLVFLLQPLLAWIVALPVTAVMLRAGVAQLGLLDAIATLLVFVGLGFEATADHQLAVFRSDPAHRALVFDRGLFRYSRHPNYFGECVLWWGFGAFGLAAERPASLVGPLLITILLLRVSGVTLLESTIGERRPGYSRYKATTNAFFPGPPRRPS
jgi:steroid 5-alpha reductase family enzyme